MLYRHRRTAALLAGISLCITVSPAFAQTGSPAPSATTSAAPSPAPSASGAGVEASGDVCAQLGLSPESNAAVKTAAVTETTATTAGNAKASGIKIAKAAGGATTKGSSAATNTVPATIGTNPSQCHRGVAQAKTDQASLNRATAAKTTLQAAANRYGIDWRVLAAIGVRETNFKNKTSGDGGEGIFQLTNQPGVSKAEAWNINFASQYAAKMISAEIRYVQNKCRNFNSTQVLQAAAAIYNFGRKARNGTDNISCNASRIDEGTTGNNYGINIINLMQCY